MRAAWLCALLLAAAPPTSGRELAVGRFLIATPQLNGFFAQSAIVLLDHGENGSLGLIVNRPLTLSLAELLPELTEAEGHDEVAFLGGPVSRGQLLVLVRSPKELPGAIAVLDGVFAIGSRESLRPLLEKPGAGVEVRGYVGYAGWAPGQLDAEIARGDWLVAPADAASVFTHDPAKLWPELWKKHQVIEVRGSPLRATVAAGTKSITLSPPWRSAAASSASRTSASPRSSTR
jgi:putative transcriptional regulator